MFSSFSTISFKATCFSNRCVVPPKPITLVFSNTFITARLSCYYHCSAGLSMSWVLESDRNCCACYTARCVQYLFPRLISIIRAPIHLMTDPDDERPAADFVSAALYQRSLNTTSFPPISLEFPFTLRNEVAPRCQNFLEGEEGPVNDWRCIRLFCSAPFTLTRTTFEPISGIRGTAITLMAKRIFGWFLPIS